MYPEHHLYSQIFDNLAQHDKSHHHRRQRAGANHF